MVSLAQGNTLRKSAFLLRILVKDYVHAGWVIDYFLRKQFLTKISSKISSEATKNSRWSVPSVCSVDKFFRNILMLYTEKCVPLYATREMMTRGSLRKTSKKRIYMMPVNNYMAQSPQPVIANDSIK